MIYITIYRFTGSQGILKVPQKWREECDLLIASVRKAIAELRIENQVRLVIKPWAIWFWEPLIKYSAWHAPILIINKKLVSQGLVPSQETLVKVLTQERM